MYEQDFNGADEIETDLLWRPDGRVQSEATDGECTWYDYDDAGQVLTQREDTGDVGTCDEADPTEEYAYDGHANRTTATVGGVATSYTVNRADQITLADTTTDVTYTYDWMGRRTSEDPTGTAVTDYTWGANDKITGATDTFVGGTLTVDLEYDGDGQLAELTATSGGTSETDSFVWDTTLGVPMITDALIGSTHHRQNYGLRRINSYLDWYSYDWQNSALYSATEYPNHPTDYTAYGKPEGLTGSRGLRWFGYRGELSLGDELTYLRNRLYDPTTGTFLSRDPLDGQAATPSETNPYHYTDNDPVNRVDPLGLSSTDNDFEPPCYGELFGSDFGSGAVIGTSGLAFEAFESLTGSLCDSTFLRAWLYMSEGLSEFQALLRPQCFLGICTEVTGFEIEAYFPVASVTMFDPKPALNEYLSGPSAPYSGVPVFDLGQPDYLYYQDILGNLIWGAFAAEFLGVLPDEVLTAMQCQEGTCDEGDNISVRAGLALGRREGLHFTAGQVRAAVLNATPKYVQNARTSHLELNQANLLKTKILPRQLL